MDHQVSAEVAPANEEANMEEQREEKVVTEGMATEAEITENMEIQGVGDKSGTDDVLENVEKQDVGNKSVREDVMGQEVEVAATEVQESPTEEAASTPEQPGEDAENQQAADESSSPSQSPELTSPSSESATTSKKPLVPVLSVELQDEVLDSGVSKVESALSEASRELSTSRSSLHNPSSSQRDLQRPSDDGGHELRPISSALESRAATEALIPPVAQCAAWPEPRDESIMALIRTEFDARIIDLVPQYFNDDPENDVWDMFMHQDPDMQPYIESYTRTRWQLSPEGCCLERRFNFLSPPSALPSIIGTSRIPITQIHRVYRPAPEQLIYRTRAQAVGVPYGSVFAIDTRWMFMAKTERRVSLRVYVEVTFLESCWIKTILRAASLGAAERATKSTGELLTALAKTRELLEKERLAQLDEEEDDVPDGARTPLSGHVSTEGLSLSPAPSQPHLDAVEDPHNATARSLPALDSAVTPTVSELSTLTTQQAKAETSQISAPPEQTPSVEAKGTSTDSLTTLQAVAAEAGDDVPPIPSMNPRLGGAKSFTLSSPSLTPVHSQLVGRLAGSLSVDGAVSPKEQRLRNRTLKRRTTLANMFDELTDDQYESIFGSDAPQRMKAAYRTKELITEKDKAQAIESTSRQRMRIWELPEGAVFAVFGTFILMCAVGYTLQRMAQARTVSDRLVEEIRSLRPIVIALGNDLNTTAALELEQLSIDRLLETLRGMAAVSTEAAQLMLVYQEQITQMQRLVRDPTPGGLNVWLSLLLFALAVGVLGTVAFSGKVIFKIRRSDV
eukprot:comp19461_c0_seq1/m.22639 comp19461_c0_seq1/g.22639  ORF comp19461_c0_seq1/g.22639 comp19461_c0_seq1/m.22639 type:complete len:792 (-) comp19461_c0_seq1:349-2724(-)